MSDNLPTLQVKNLETHFFTKSGVAKAVNGANFDVKRGEIMGLVGESGSGKSVTGFSLIGLVDEPGRVVSGSIKFKGEELIGASEKRMQDLRGNRIAMIFQDPMMTLNPVLRIDTQMIEAIQAHENVDKKTTVGPFLKIPRYADPKPTPAFGFTPDAENSQCSWTDLSCIRKYYQENGDLVLKCKHFAPVPQPYADCNKLTKFLPADGKKVFFNSPDNPYPDNPYMVAPSYTNAKPDEYWAACIEGNNPSDMYAAGLERIGASLSTHGSVHTAIGGSLATPYSPNDPMFAHLHGNVDRMWALYQEQHGTGAWFENVAKDRLDTPMPLFKNPTVTIRDVLDMNKMPFKYA